MMPYSLLIGLGAGAISAVVFASATTGPLLMRMVLFVLTPLALFLAGLGAGPAMAALGGATGTILVYAVGGPAAALIFAASQALPVFALVYLASLNRVAPSGSREWYPEGRLVIAAALLAGAFATLTLIMLGGDAELLRSKLRDLLQQFVTNELPKMPDAPTVSADDIDQAASVALALLPAASAMLTMGSLLFNMWLAGRITLASGRLQRPWPDLPAMTYPSGTPLLLAALVAAGFMTGLPGLIARAFAGPMFFAYLLLGLAIVHFITRGSTWRPFALWAMYLLLFVMNSLASLALALLGLADAIWPLRKPPRPSDGRPKT
jgi:hypothetical protein